MKKVLIADDTKNIRILLTKCLEIEGYQVITANDGLQALDLFNREHFVLAFLDIKMPELSGTEVLKKIRERGIKTPVIIITAYATIKNAVECTQMGAVAYLQKPFTADKIRILLKELVPGENEENEIKTVDNSIERIYRLIEKGCFQQAIDMIKISISHNLTNPELFLLLSKAYDGINDKEHAEKFYKTYLLFSK